MKKLLTSCIATLLFAVILPAEATLIYYDTFAGTVTGTGGGMASYPAGTPVTGSFQYDLDLMSGGQPSSLDPALSFVLYIGAQSFGYSSQTGSGLGFMVDANGFPVSGSAAGPWDLAIAPGGAVTLWTFGNNYIHTQVAYGIPSVPEAGQTVVLLGAALAVLGVMRKFVQSI